MKNKTIEYTAADDVNAIVCDLSDAELRVIPAQENELKITCKNPKGLHISRNEAVLTMKQCTRTHIFKTKKIIIELSIPDHILPDITVSAKACNVNITGGIYGQFTLSGDKCAVQFAECSFTACELTGVTLSTFFNGVTVKNTLVVKCGAGDIIWENSFASCTECRVKRGNIGLSGFNCKTGFMEAENGNVAARLNGEESEYNLGLLIKEGTSNRESVQREGAARSFKAYSAKGNIAIDFMPEEGACEYGDNRLWE